jgi:Outer membrane protein beta-barrel domain
MTRSVKLLLIGALLLGPARLSAQTVVSLRAGLNVATLGGGDVAINPDHRIGVNIGGAVTIPMSENLGLLLGATYSQKGAAPPVDLGANLVLALDYLEIPALLEFMIPSSGMVGAHVLAGPVIGLELSCDATGSAGGFEVSVGCDQLGANTKTFDLGAAAGFGVDVQATERVTLTLDLLYDLGLVSIQDGLDVKNRAFTIQAGLGIPIGGS